MSDRKETLMEPEIRHNADVEKHALTELKKAFDQLGQSLVIIERQTESAGRMWNGAAAEKIMSRALNTKNEFAGCLSKLEEVIGEIELISRRIQEAEQEAKRIAEERGV